MKTIVERLRREGHIFKALLEIAPKELGIRNRIRLFKATATNGDYAVIFFVEQKSRILSKEVERYEAIVEKLVRHCDHNFKNRYLIVSAPLCSKAKKGFEMQGWKVLHNASV